MTERGGVTAVTFVPAARGRDGRRQVVGQAPPLAFSWQFR